MVLEAISRGARQTYVTELRIEGRQVPGCGYDAGCSIADPLMEQSPQFTRASSLRRPRMPPNEAGESSISRPISPPISDPERECICCIEKSHHLVADPSGGDLCRSCGRVAVHCRDRIVDVIDQRARVASSSAMLEQLEGRKARRGPRLAR